LKIGNPGPKSLLKRPAVKPAKDRANGLGRGYAVLKNKETGLPVDLKPAKAPCSRPDPRNGITNLSKPLTESSQADMSSCREYAECQSR
jgi:hypothetical protein